MAEKSTSVPNGQTTLYVTHTESSPTPASTSNITSTGSSAADPSAQTAASTSSGGLSAGASAGIGVGVALAVLLLALIAFLLYRRHRGRAAKDTIPGPSGLGNDGQKYELPTEEARRIAELGVDGQKHELPTNTDDGNHSHQNSHLHELE